MSTMFNVQERLEFRPVVQRQARGTHQNQTTFRLYSKLSFVFVSLSQIVFKATRGSSIRSDIAIDDIILESGPCPGKPSI